MNMMYNFLLEENEKLKKQISELIEHISIVQIACSHLLQDGEVSGEGFQTVKNLLSLTEELQDKYAKKD